MNKDPGHLFRSILGDSAADRSARNIQFANEADQRQQRTAVIEGEVRRRADKLLAAAADALAEINPPLVCTERIRLCSPPPDYIGDYSGPEWWRDADVTPIMRLWRLDNCFLNGLYLAENGTLAVGSLGTMYQRPLLFFGRLSELEGARLPFSQVELACDEGLDPVIVDPPYTRGRVPSGSVPFSSEPPAIPPLRTEHLEHALANFLRHVFV